MKITSIRSDIQLPWGSVKNSVGGAGTAWFVGLFRMLTYLPAPLRLLRTPTGAILNVMPNQVVHMLVTRIGIAYPFGNLPCHLTLTLSHKEWRSQSQLRLAALYSVPHDSVWPLLRLPLSGYDAQQGSLEGPKYHEGRSSFQIVQCIPPTRITGKDQNLTKKYEFLSYSI